MIKESDPDFSKVETLLGRRPRGLCEIVHRDQKGDPSVIRVASLVENKPFPTLFWLINKDLKKRLDRLEASGLIQELEDKIEHNPKMQEQLKEDNTRYISLRNEYMSNETKDKLKELNYYEHLQKIGIGGISNFSKVRCLHMQYAFHLVSKNMIGSILDENYLS